MAAPPAHNTRRRPAPADPLPASNRAPGPGDARHRGRHPRRPRRVNPIGVVRGGTGPRPLPPAGFVRFRAAHHPALGLIAELNGLVIPAGYGTHDVTDRVGRLALTEYHGRPPLTLQIPLLFDRWAERSDVEREIRMLETLAGLDAHITQPPDLIVEGHGVPHSHTRDTRLRFALDGDPVWDGDVRYCSRDARSFVPVTVTAMQVNRPAAVQDAVDDRPDRPRETFTVRRGSPLHTLRRIARHRHVEWRRLRRLNPRLGGDPDHTLKPGTRVRVA